jgi:hypothetical protein
MPVEEDVGTVREVVGVFNSPENLEEAIDELLSAGFDRAELSLLASEHAVEEKLRHQYEKAGTLADDPTVPRAAYVSTEAIGGAAGGLIGGLMYVGAIVAASAVVASGGTLAAAIVAAGLTGGDHHAHYLQEQMNHGGLLLWVHARDVALEKRAIEILKKHSGADVHVHVLPTAA